VKTIDIVKSIGAAVAIMVLNVIISIVAVAGYSYVINPGLEAAHYEAVSQTIIYWSANVVGFFLFLGAGYIFAKRKPKRNAVKFAVLIWASYFVIEFITIAGSGIDSVKLKSMTGVLAISLVTKLFAAIAGAKLGETTPKEYS